jgi:hypothetical protein
MFPVLPTQRIVVESALLGLHGDQYANALVTWHNDFHP